MIFDFMSRLTSWKSFKSKFWILKVRGIMGQFEPLFGSPGRVRKELAQIFTGQVHPEEFDPEGVMVMWFFDEAEDLEEYQAFRQEASRLEKEHLELRVALRDAEAALRSDPENEDLRSRVKELEQKLEKLVQRAPWLTSDIQIEYALWGPPH
jgi:hypothetical protein